MQPAYILMFLELPLLQEQSKEKPSPHAGQLGSCPPPPRLKRNREASKCVHQLSLGYSGETDMLRENYWGQRVKFGPNVLGTK